MNNQFVKDSLLPDEKILATAKFHPLKNLISSIIFVLLSATLFVVLISFTWSSTIYNGFIVHSYSDDHATYDYICGINTTSEDRAERYIHGSGEEAEVFPHMKVNEFESMAGRSLDHMKWHYKYKISGFKCLCWWGITFIIGFLLYLLMKWINSKDEFVITNKRVVAKVGVIRRIAFELLIEQMESIEVHQGIIGRILKFGTEMPCGVGASKVRIPFVMNPFEFRQHFYDIKKVSEPTPATPKSATPQAQTTEQKYFAQPQSDGKFHIVEKNSITGEFVTIKGEVYDTEFEARKRAKELNAEYNS